MMIQQDNEFGRKQLAVHDEWEWSSRTDNSRILGAADSFFSIFGATSVERNVQKSEISSGKLPDGKRTPFLPYVCKVQIVATARLRAVCVIMHMGMEQWEKNNTYIFCQTRIFFQKLDNTVRQLQQRKVC